MSGKNIIIGLTPYVSKAWVEELTGSIIYERSCQHFFYRYPPGVWPMLFGRHCDHAGVWRVRCCSLFGCHYGHAEVAQHSCSTCGHTRPLGNRSTGP